jgi:endonuclease/exonuclease/phosphatase family metal-dependent hydrolase
MRLLVLFFLTLPAAAFAQSLRLVTYNIRYDNPQDGENAWEKRREFLCQQMEFYGPDVIGVQEAMHHQLEYMAGKMPAYRFVGVGRDDGEQGGEYSAIFYRTGRLELLDSGTFWLSPTPREPSKGWDAAMNRVCTYALLRDSASRQAFWVFNTHFDHIGKQARESSARLILEQIARRNKAGLPVALIGDLNAEPQEAPIAVLRETLADARDLSRAPAFGPEGTFNGFDFHQPVRRRIDYIFVSPGVRVLKHAVLSDNRECRYPSDHLPVLAEVEMR